MENLPETSRLQEDSDGAIEILIGQASTESKARNRTYNAFRVYPITGNVKQPPPYKCDYVKIQDKKSGKM